MTVIGHTYTCALETDYPYITSHSRYSLWLVQGESVTYTARVYEYNYNSDTNSWSRGAEVTDQVADNIIWDKYISTDVTMEPNGATCTFTAQKVDRRSDTNLRIFIEEGGHKYEAVPDYSNPVWSITVEPGKLARAAVSVNGEEYASSDDIRVAVGEPATFDVGLRDYWYDEATGTVKSEPVEDTIFNTVSSGVDVTLADSTGKAVSQEEAVAGPVTVTRTGADAGWLSFNVLRPNTSTDVPSTHRWAVDFQVPLYADLSAATVDLDTSSYTYDGKAKTPAVTVTLDGKTLVENQDYTVAYSNNVNAGTAKVTVTGQGAFVGSKTATFTIKAKAGWQKTSGKWYYYGSDGKALTGWQKISGKWYYLKAPSGEMLTGWQKISNKWYYFKSGGDMVTGWQKISNKWYYFNSGGDMVSGWKKISNSWYYFNSGGAMLTGWQKISGSWYYFYSSGKMAVNTYVGGYYLTSSGKMA